MAEPTTIAVDVGNETLGRIEQRVRDLKFADVKTYLSYLISIDLANDKPHAEHLMKQIYQAEASGVGRTADEAYFQTLRERSARVINNAADQSERAAG